MKRIIGSVVTSIMLLTSFSAFARHISPQEINIIKELAHDLEKESRRLHKRAESIIVNPTDEQEILIENLHDFEKLSRRFHMEVERNMNTPMGRRGSLRPALARRTDLATLTMASS